MDLGPQRSRLRAGGALPVEHHAQCTMTRDEEQGSFTPWADAGRHTPSTPLDKRDCPRCKKWNFGEGPKLVKPSMTLHGNGKARLIVRVRLKSSPMKPKQPRFHWRLRCWTLSCARELCVQGRARACQGAQKKDIVTLSFNVRIQRACE